MEQTFALSRTNKRLCLFAIAGFAVAMPGAFVLSVWCASRLDAVVGAGGHAMGFAALFGVLAVVALHSMMAEAVTMLAYSVVVSDDAIRVGKSTLIWDEIKSVEHPAWTIGLAFRIVTFDETSADVYPVGGARQLERLIGERLSARSNVAITQPEEYKMGRRCSVALEIALTTLAAGMLLVCAGIAVHLLGLQASEGPASRFAATPSPLLILVAWMLHMLMDPVRRLLRFKVVALEQTIRVGETRVRWDEIQGIEETWTPGVAFRLSMRDGSRLSVYSGTEGIEQLKSVVKSRLCGDGVGGQHLSPSA